MNVKANEKKVVEESNDEMARDEKEKEGKEAKKGVAVAVPSFPAHVGGVELIFGGQHAAIAEKTYAGSPTHAF